MSPRSLQTTGSDLGQPVLVRSAPVKVWAVGLPRYGYATSEWMVSMSDGSVERFKSRFDALVFIKDNGTPTLKQQLEASLREDQERTEYRFEEEDNDRQYCIDEDEVD